MHEEKVLFCFLSNKNYFSKPSSCETIINIFCRNLLFALYYLFLFFYFFYIWKMIPRSCICFDVLINTCSVVHIKLVKQILEFVYFFFNLKSCLYIFFLIFFSMLALMCFLGTSVSLCPSVLIALPGSWMWSWLYC